MYQTCVVRKKNALQCAIDSGRLDMASILLEHGCDPNEWQGTYREDPLYLANTLEDTFLRKLIFAGARSDIVDTWNGLNQVKVGVGTREMRAAFRIRAIQRALEDRQCMLSSASYAEQVRSYVGIDGVVRMVLDYIHDADEYAWMKKVLCAQKKLKEGSKAISKQVWHYDEARHVKYQEPVVQVAEEVQEASF